MELGADVNFVGINGLTPLMIACSSSSKGCYDVIELLLLKGAQVNAKNSDG